MGRIASFIRCETTAPTELDGAEGAGRLKSSRLTSGIGADGRIPWHPWHRAANTCSTSQGTPLGAEVPESAGELGASS